MSSWKNPYKEQSRKELDPVWIEVLKIAAALGVAGGTLIFLLILIAKA